LPADQPYNEHELLSQVAAGNEQAFTFLFHQWQPFLSTHIYRITESRELTEEIVQDAFLKIWQTRETLPEVRNFRNFLIVISKHQALNALQKISREFQNWEKWVKEDAANGDQHDPAAQFYILLDEAIDQLTERQRQVYLLHRHEKLTYQQIADRLNIGKESVKTHIELAVKHISAHLRSRIGLYFTLISLFY
jgi:RNA polymerase sigma factor (sigma-70 family)